MGKFPRPVLVVEVVVEVEVYMQDRVFLSPFLSLCLSFFFFLFFFLFFLPSTRAGVYHNYVRIISSIVVEMRDRDLPTADW